MLKAQLVTRAGKRFGQLEEAKPSRQLTKEDVERIIAEHNRNIDRLTVRRDFYQGLLSMYESGK